MALEFLINGYFKQLLINFFKKITLYVTSSSSKVFIFFKGSGGIIVAFLIYIIHGNTLATVFFSQTKSENLLLTVQPNGFVTILYSIKDEVKYPP